MPFHELDPSSLMLDEDSAPGGSQERFVMSLLAGAANKKGYQALQLPLLTLLLKGQMQGFDQARAKQAKTAQQLKQFQMKKLLKEAEHEDARMKQEQVEAQLRKNLPRELMRPVEDPGIGGPAVQTDVGDNPVGMAFGNRPPNLQEQMARTAQAYPKEASGLLGKMFEKPQQDPIEVLRRLQGLQGGGQSAQAGSSGVRPFGGIEFVPSVSGKGEVSFSGQHRGFDPGTNEAMRAVTGMGIAENDPRLPELLSEYIRAKALVGAEAQNLAFQDLQQKVERIKQSSPTAPSISGAPQVSQPAQGGSLLDRVTALKAREAETITRAREKAQREESRLPENVNRRISGYREMDRGIEVITDLWEKNPGAVGWVGKGIAPFASQWNKALDQMLELAGKKEYLDGAIVGRVEEFLGTLPPGQVEFYRRTLFLQDQMLRAQSGQQTAEQEAGRLARLVPRVTDEPTVFLEKLTGLAEQSNTTIKDLLEGATKSPKQMLEDRTKAGAVRTPGQKTNILRNKSKSGKPIISKDGGKTWEYE